ncbi:hypothetical protein [Kiloniella sp. b19]|uniref:hypothetical protein n=1 Tax=Kiloniella sp. GXU_MW_B19 TaxID=3141326 RepID=UPI0031CF61AC
MSALASGSSGIPPTLKKAFLVNFIWINLSEVFRYFVFIMPMIRKSFPELPGIAPMNLGIFSLWGLWDLILIIATTGFVWLYQNQFGLTLKNSLSAGFLVWVAIFGILWLALFNLNLATASILSIALPLSCLELLIAAWIVFRVRTGRRQVPE